jgi:hypothetical protein
VAKNKKPQWLALHDVLYEAVLAGLPPREDRDLTPRCFPASSGRTCARRSPEHARRRGRRTSHRTGCGSGAGRCSRSRATRWLRSASGLATRRSSRPSTTCTPSGTTPRPTTRPRWPADGARNGGSAGPYGPAIS